MARFNVLVDLLFSRLSYPNTSKQDNQGPKIDVFRLNSFVYTVGPPLIS